MKYLLIKEKNKPGCPVHKNQTANDFLRDDNFENVQLTPDTVQFTCKVCNLKRTYKTIKPRIFPDDVANDKGYISYMNNKT